ncbi:hypothetical protein VTO42DRAFT_8409 [Malbranchea cinnamomea]
MHDRMTPASSPTTRFMDRLFYHYKKAVAKNVLLEQENMKLCTANRKQEQRKRKSRYAPQGGAAGCVQTNNEDSKQEDENLTQQAFEIFVQSDSNDPMHLADREFVQGTNNEPDTRDELPIIAVCVGLLSILLVPALLLVSSVQRGPVVDSK